MGEILEWFDGLEKVRAEENAFSAEFEEFFGRPPEATSRHHIIGATQQYAVAAEMQLPSFYGVPASVPAVNGISFCCGALITPHTEAGGHVGTGFDRSYSDDAQTDISIQRIEDEIEYCHQTGKSFLNIYLGYPLMVRGMSPWFIYFTGPNGQNLSRNQADALGQAPIKPASVMPTVRRNFDRVCHYIGQHPDLDVINVHEMQQRYAWHKPSVTAKDLIGCIDHFLATRIDTLPGDEGDIPLNEWFTPAEILAALTDSIVMWSMEENLPDQVPRRDVLGPTTLPLICPELPRLSRDQMMRAAHAVAHDLNNSGYLPGNITLDGRNIGLGSYLYAASEFYRQLNAGHPVEGIELPRQSLRYPGFAHDIDTSWRRMILEDGTTDPRINLDRFCQHARLQSWTIKPAHRKK